MKKVIQIASGVALASSAMAFSAAASAEISYNVGFASEYYYRGIYQNTSSASAGVDYEESGFYLGAWTADVGDGVEIDGYLGYGLDLGNDVSLSAGFTGYYYTGDFDDTYEEINVSLGIKAFTLSYAQGKYDNFGDSVDYNYLEAMVELNGFYAKAGAFGDDFNGDFLEFGYGFTAADLDFGVSVILNNKDLNGWDPEDDSTWDIDDDQTLIFTVGKTW